MTTLRVSPGIWLKSAAILSLAILGGCAAPASDDAVSDPFETANRRVHAFNTGLDAHLLRPLSRPGSGSGEGPLLLARNVSRNLSLPGKALNHLLQGRPGPAGRNLARFAVNSTLGLGGLHDPAGREFALNEIDTDFGETLHVWGAGEGPYLELPVLGPSNGRDLAGKVVDWAANPLRPLMNGDQRRGALVLKAAAKAGDRARFGATVDSVLHDSADSYAQTRLIYTQHRRHELGQEAEIIDPYAD